MSASSLAALAVDTPAGSTTSMAAAATSAPRRRSSDGLVERTMCVPLLCNAGSRLWAPTAVPHMGRHGFLTIERYLYSILLFNLHWHSKIAVGYSIIAYIVNKMTYNCLRFRIIPPHFPSSTRPKSHPTGIKRDDGGIQDVPIRQKSHPADARWDYDGMTAAYSRPDVICNGAIYARPRRRT